MLRYARRGCLRCGAELRAATILLPFATLTASATALLSASRYCGTSRLRARPLRRWCGTPRSRPPSASLRLFALACHKPRRRARVKPCAYAPLPSSSFAAVRLLPSCLVSRSLSFGVASARPLSASVPLVFGTPAVPPPYPFFAVRPPLGGARSPVCAWARAAALPPPLALTRLWFYCG